MAAELLLRSLNQDKSMTLLVQTLYDTKIFTFDKFYDWLLIEATQQTSVETKSAYFSSQNLKFGKQSADHQASLSS
jgi:hypothetical protein